MLKRVMIVMMAMSIALMFVADTNAAVCVAKVGGKCVLWSGSWICEIAATGLGDCENKSLGCDIEGSGRWSVICGAPGNANVAPGQNIFFFEGEASGTAVVDPSQCTKNGSYTAEVTATIDQETKDAILAAGACANPNWQVLDAISEFVNLTDYEYEDDLNDICPGEDYVVVATATFNCELPNIETLGIVWLPDENPPRWGFEERQYNCTRQSYEVYKSPKCPSEVLGQ